MKLVEFRIRNFKSIKDSGNVYLPSEDSINILAGQNEAGKTAGLKAFQFFEEGAYAGLEDDIRVGASPCVEVTFLPNDKECSELSEVMSSEVARFFKKNGVTWFRGDESSGSYDEIFYDCPDDEHLENELVRIYSQRNIEQREKIVSETSSSDTPSSSDAPSDDTHEIPREEIIDEMYDECFGFFEERRPKFVYYSAELENNILPSKITAGEIKDNQAVLDFQKVFDINLANLFKEGVTDQQRRFAEASIEAKASDQLNRYWQQKISGEEKQYGYTVSLHEDNANPPKSRIEFYVSQSDGIPLKMAQKSRGFRWFTGFNLRLRAHEEDLKNRKIILLIDEPGFNLHETGQRDVKAILEEISRDPGMQIIYSSHLPIMLGGAGMEMSRILLVVKDKDGATYFKTIGQAVGNGDARDALSPIRSALGLVTLNGFYGSGKCLLVEGIVDYYYLRAGLGRNYRIVPAVSADQVPGMFGMLIGFGCEPRVLLDGDRKGKSIKKKLGAKYFGNNNDEIEKTVMVLEGANGIEELLTKDDAEAVLGDLGADFDNGKSIIENIEGIGKLIFAKRFSEMYENDSSRFSQELHDKLDMIRNFYDRV